MDIHKYLKLGIKNGFKSYRNYRCHIINFGENPDFIFANILAQNREMEVLTSREFIEAVEKNSGLGIEDITHKQAEAIRDGKLLEFINYYFTF